MSIKRRYSKSATLRTLAFYWEVTRAQPGLFALSIASSLAFIFFLSFAVPYVVALVVDRISSAAPTSEQVLDVFGPYLLAFLAVNILGQVGSKLQDYSVWKLEIGASYRLATKCFDTLSNQSMTFHSDRFGGSLVSQTQKFISGYNALLENLVYAILPIIMSAIFTIVLLAAAVPLFCVLLAALLVIYVVVAYLLYKRVLPLNTGAAHAQNALSGELSDSITNIQAVKTYGRESYERELFDKANRDVVRADSKRMRASTFRGAVTAAIIVVIMSMASLFIAGGNAWFGISPGVLVMMFTYTYAITMQFNRINMTFQAINRGFGDAHDMTLVLDEPCLVADKPDAAALTVAQGNIDFNQTTFWYNDGGAQTQVFKDFSLSIPAGQRVGLVGRSGSGKTTLTTLLLRLADLQEGQILIDRQDIAACTQVSLRQQIAYVPQEPLLFHRTIAENIAYGNPSATPQDIRTAARRANALEFIEHLPHGFETVTGERGIKLSGGQRQRIAIARAILADKPILVLDEATSALDSESERLIQEALANLMAGRTCIVVAHRLSTVAALDRIVVLSDGAIAEEGTHADLLENHNEYAKLWNRQSGAYLFEG